MFSNYFINLLLLVGIFSGTSALSQLPDFFYQLPNSFKLEETTEEEVRQNKNLILDSTDYSILYRKRDRYEVNYKVYRWECELYCYIDTASKKLTGIKIWNTSENWESNGIKIGMMENDFLNYLKNHDLKYSAYKCKYFNDYTVETARLAYSFSFPMDDEISVIAPCWDDTAHALEYIYVGLNHNAKKLKNNEPAVY